MQISYTQICLERQTSFHAPVSDKAEQMIGSWENLRLYCCPKATGRERFFKRFHLEMNPAIKSLLDSQWDRETPTITGQSVVFFFCSSDMENGEQSELLCKLINLLRASTLNSWSPNHRQRWHGHRLDGQGVVFHGALHQLWQLRMNRHQYKANFKLPRCSGVVFLHGGTEILTSDLVKERHGAMSSL